MNPSFFERVRALIVKELQVLLNDPQSRRLLIMPVLIQIIIYPFAATLEVKNNTIAVYNQDSGPAAIELMQRLSMAKAFTHFKMVHSDHELRRVIDNQEALLVVRFPEDFSR